MSYQQETFDIQGVKFRLKSSSVRNMRGAQDFLENRVEEIGVGEVTEDTQWEVLAEMNMAILEACAEPVGDEGFDAIEAEAIDSNKVNHYFQQFMGKSPTTSSALNAY